MVAESKLQKIREELSDVSLENLDSIEKEVVQKRLEGKTFKQIAGELGTSDEWARLILKKIIHPELKVKGKKGRPTKDRSREKRSTLYLDPHIYKTMVEMSRNEGKTLIMYTDEICWGILSGHYDYLIDWKEKGIKRRGVAFHQKESKAVRNYLKGSNENVASMIVKVMEDRMKANADPAVEAVSLQDISNESLVRQNSELKRREKNLLEQIERMKREQEDLKRNLEEKNMEL